MTYSYRHTCSDLVLKNYHDGCIRSTMLMSTWKHLWSNNHARMEWQKNTMQLDLDAQIRLGNNNKVNYLTSVLVIYRRRRGRLFIRPPHYGCQSSKPALLCLYQWYNLSLIKLARHSLRTSTILRSLCHFLSRKRFILLSDGKRRPLKSVVDSCSTHTLILCFWKPYVENWSKVEPATKIPQYWTCCLIGSSWYGLCCHFVYDPKYSNTSRWMKPEMISSIISYYTRSHLCCNIHRVPFLHWSSQHIQ